MLFNIDWRFFKSIKVRARIVMKDVVKMAFGQKAYNCLLFMKPQMYKLGEMTFPDILAVSVFSLDTAIKEFFEYFRV